MSDTAREAESAHPWLPERTAGPTSIRPADIYLSERRVNTLVQHGILRLDANGAFVRNGGRP
jgi:hypothetical protein